MYYACITYSIIYPCTSKHSQDIKDEVKLELYDSHDVRAVNIVFSVKDDVFISACMGHSLIRTCVQKYTFQSFQLFGHMFRFEDRAVSGKLYRKQRGSISRHFKGKHGLARQFQGHFVGLKCNKV